MIMMTTQFIMDLNEEDGVWSESAIKQEVSQC